MLKLYVPGVASCIEKYNFIKINYFDQISKLILYFGHIKETTNDHPPPPHLQNTVLMIIFDTHKR